MVALTAWLSFFLSAAAATAVAPSTAMVGALPIALEEPRAPRREGELGAELRGPGKTTRARMGVEHIIHIRELL